MPTPSRTTRVPRPLTPPTSSPFQLLLASSVSVPPRHGQISRLPVFPQLTKMSRISPSPLPPVAPPLQPSSRSPEAATFQSALPPHHSPTFRLRGGRFSRLRFSCFQPPPPRQLPPLSSLMQMGRWGLVLHHRTRNCQWRGMDCSVVHFQLVAWAETLSVSQLVQTERFQEKA